MSLIPDERQRIYEEEKARMEAQHQLAEEQSVVRNRKRAYAWLSLCAVLVWPSVSLGLTLRDRFNEANSSSTSPYGISEFSMSGSLSIAQDYVKDELKAPSTATFSPIEEEKAEAIGPKQVRVTGWVDAQNSFGAKLRSKYTVVMRLIGTDSIGRDTWQAESVHFDSDVQKD